MKWIGQHIWDLAARFRNDVYLDSPTAGGSDPDKFLGVDATGKIIYRTGAQVASDIGAITSETGDISSVTLGTDSVGLTVGSGDVNWTLAGGNAITTVGSGGDTITINHDDTSSQASVNNSGVRWIQDVTLDTYGHVTGLTSAALGNATDEDLGIASFASADFSVSSGAVSLIDLTVAHFAGAAIQTASESFADNDTSLMTSAAIDDRINTAHATVQTGKNYRIVNTSFRADIGTTKYYLPLKSQDEQTVLTREENQEIAVCDGRLVSLTWRAENFNTHSGDATVTFGVETNTVGSSYSGGYSVIETEVVTVNHADDNHLWHVVFDTAKHWDSTDMFTISMQSDTDITGNNERIFITLVIEDDWSTYLAGTTREIDTTP